MDPTRGIYLTTDRDYAVGNGPNVTRWRVGLDRPYVVRHEQAGANVEVDRAVLASRGYDGRIVVYDDGTMDVVAFETTQCVPASEVLRPPGF